MSRILLLIVAIFALGVPMVAHAEPPAFGTRMEVAQKRQTLWDQIFGPSKKTQKKVTVKRKSTSSSKKRRKASLPPVKPAVEKNAGATRLVVFGDSLAVDLAKAMERFYAEDPNLQIIGQGVGSSGFVREDFFNWQTALDEALAANSFDIAVIAIGINDRQNLRVSGSSAKPLTEKWKGAYLARLNNFAGKIRTAGKPLIWLGLPPMKARSYSAAMTQISSLHKLAAVSNGAEFVDVYERFADEAGNYTSFGPDINGVSRQMRKGDGIHFSSAGSDKVAFYINQALKSYYRGGAVSLAIADPLAETDAVAFARLPFQGLGQMRLLEVAGAVVSMREVTERRSGQLLIADPAQAVRTSFSLDDLVMAPSGRADAFGVGVDLATQTP
jgi:hypothetical protein